MANRRDLSRKRNIAPMGIRPVIGLILGVHAQRITENIWSQHIHRSSIHHQQWQFSSVKYIRYSFAGIVEFFIGIAENSTYCLFSYTRSSDVIEIQTFWRSGTGLKCDTPTNGITKLYKLSIHHQQLQIPHREKNSQISLFVQSRVFLPITNIPSSKASYSSHCHDVIEKAHSYFEFLLSLPNNLHGWSIYHWLIHHRAKRFGN